jgi:hypothetical protein
MEGNSRTQANLEPKAQNKVKEMSVLTEDSWTI